MTTARAALCALLVSAGGASGQTAPPGPSATASGSPCATASSAPAPPGCPTVSEDASPLAASSPILTRSRRAQTYAGMAWTLQWLRRETTAGPAPAPAPRKTPLPGSCTWPPSRRQWRKHERTPLRLGPRPAVRLCAGRRRPARHRRMAAISPRRSRQHAPHGRASISALFDSARASRLSQDELLRTLIRLNRVNDANESAWFAITSEINRMADSATVANGGAPHRDQISACVLWHLVVACRGGSASGTSPKPN